MKGLIIIFGSIGMCVLFVTVTIGTIWLLERYHR